MDKLYVLAPFFRVGLQSGALYLGFGSIQMKIEDPDLQKTYLKVAARFLSPSSLNFNDDHEKAIANELVKKNIIVGENCYKGDDRYSRHHLYYLMSGSNAEDVQSKLRVSTVTILGCGGIGNLLSVALANAGVGKIILVDNDIVDITNLTRQFIYSESDVGRSKIEVLKAAIESKNSNCSVQIFNQCINSVDDLYSLPKSDLIVGSADSGDVCDLVNLFSVNTGIPWVNVGYIEDIAVWGPFVIPGLTGCTACWNYTADEDDQNHDMRIWMELINKRYQAPSNAPINMLSISLATLDILKYLGKFGEVQSLNKRIGLWTHQLRIEEQIFAKNSNCKVCARI